MRISFRRTRIQWIGDRRTFLMNNNTYFPRKREHDRELFPIELTRNLPASLEIHRLCTHRSYQAPGILRRRSHCYSATQNSLPPAQRTGLEKKKKRKKKLNLVSLSSPHRVLSSLGRTILKHFSSGSRYFRRSPTCRDKLALSRPPKSRHLSFDRRVRVIFPLSSFFLDPVQFLEKQRARSSA